MRALLLAILGAALVLPATTAAAEPPPPELPEPTFGSVAQEVLVTMDDGIRLAGTIALPSADGQTPLPGPFPVVVGMTPYSRNGVCGCFPPDFWATRGMAGAVFDVRGTGGSEGDLGENFFSPREARDSAAVIEFLGTRPWSTGKVGMAGGSYVGITQYLAAEQRPPHLAAITPAVAVSDLYRDGYAHGGIQSLSFDAQYIAVQGAPGTAGANNDPFLLEETLKAKLGQSPPGSIAFDYLSRPTDDPFYRDRSPIYGADRIEVPALIIGGWRDGLLRGAPEMYRRLARRPGVETRLLIDPCTHKGCGAPFAPLTDPAGQPDLVAHAFEFLSRHLTNAETPDRPPVQFHLQGAGADVAADRWPPAGTRYERLALGAGTLGGKGEGPATQDYVTNPAAGFSMAFDKYGTVAGTPYVPTDQRLEGPQGLTFRTAPFDAPRDLVGPSALHLVAASTATDTDWYVKLSDVAPDGTESIIEAGALRASHRALDPAKSTPARPYHTHVDPRPIEPGRFHEYDIEIWPTAYRLAAGHRLQLRLTSSDLPTHLPGSAYVDRDRPQDARVDLHPPATNTVRLAESHLVLPVGDATAAAQPPLPTAPSAAKRCAPSRRTVRVRRGRAVLRVALTKAGRRVGGAAVSVRGPGFRRRATTNRAGHATFRVRVRRAGRVRVSAAVCGARLRI